MEKTTFNLLTEPWIEVIDLAGKPQTVSLYDVLKHGTKYRELIGDMRVQGLTTLRLLLAILITVYSRYDATNQAYRWLTVNPDTMQDVGEVDDTAYDDSEWDNGQGEVSEQPRYIVDLLKTWQQLEDQQGFTPIVFKYLKHYANHFDFFGDQPFYQVTQQQYNALVPKDAQVDSTKNNKGRLNIRQINRQVSESANKSAPFSPRTEALKDQLSLPALVRWTLTYQNYAGVTDKVKTANTVTYNAGVTRADKIPNASGWLYELYPVFAKGSNVFETLMLNLILINRPTTQNADVIPYVHQKPVWEFQQVTDYIHKRESAKQAEMATQASQQPDNLAALYTVWSRLIYINWDTGAPLIYTCGVPMFSKVDALVEPMTTWKWRQQADSWVPDYHDSDSLGAAMWQNFGHYVNIPHSSDTGHPVAPIPGTVAWLKRLTAAGLTKPQTALATNSLVYSNSQATSKMPAASLHDSFEIKTDVLFDTHADHWPARITDMVALAMAGSSGSIGQAYKQLVRSIFTIRGQAGNGLEALINENMAVYYQGLNQPFKDWLKTLTDDDDRDARCDQWKASLKQYVYGRVNQLKQNVAPKDIQGTYIKGIHDHNHYVNIFIALNRFYRQVNQIS